MAKLFFLLSGENETLPVAELRAILEAEGFAFEVKEQLDQVVRLESSQDSVNSVHRRSAYTRTCGLELFACEAEENAIMKSAETVDFKSVLGKGESFAVRVKRVKEYSRKIVTVPLEGKLGKHILHSTTGTKVNLRKPDKTFFGVLTSGKLVFGLKLAEMEILTFSERRPRKKPFFHPSAMPSKLARCMVNLSRAKAGELVLDPFCGTGSVMVEAGFVGCRVLGFDIQRRMAEGTRRNLEHFGVDAEGLVIADSRKLPLVRIDRVVTDPPYGKSATTMKSTTKRLVEGVFASARSLLGIGQLICIASPKTLGISRVGKELGYRHVESHFAYVHGTLTREIAVFEMI
ncbi:MAG: THUMP domain-containing protein [Candidatus Bathyarchaeota archaeon]|nr:THUMP domain-containing protein [Candidatus Bathyarchaeota archaeon]